MKTHAIDKAQANEENNFTNLTTQMQLLEKNAAKWEKSPDFWYIFSTATQQGNTKRETQGKNYTTKNKNTKY